MPLLQDLRFAVRTFARQPGFSLAAILTIALGIGANTAVFSVLYSTVLAPFPFPDPDALVFVSDSEPAAPNTAISLAKYRALKEGTRTLSGLAALTSAAVTLGDGDPEQVFASRMSADFSRVLGLDPAIGRWFTPDEDTQGAPAVIVLSHQLWTRRFGGDPKIVGRPITVDGRPHLVVGVMDAEFAVLSLAEAWLPLATSEAPPAANSLALIGRLARGRTLEQAQAELAALSAAYNERAGTTRAVVVRPLLDVAVAADRPAMLLLQGMVVVVLLVAAANVANLLLARSVTRRRELAIRIALGAGRGRIVSQLLTESVVLALAGALLGLLLAGWLVRLFLALAPATFVRREFIDIDPVVLWFTGIVAVVTGLTFGLAPALRAWRLTPREDLAGGGRTAAGRGIRTASRALVVAEIALALVLVVGAALLMTGLLRLQSTSPGFTAEGVLTFELALPSSRYPVASTPAFYERLLEDLRQLPGVQSAAAISALPLAAFAPGGGPVRLPGEPEPPAGRPSVQFRAVTSSYFETLGIALLRGELPDATAAAPGRPVVLVNETMAARLWAGRDPLGERIQLGSNPASPWREVVGVVGDVRSAGLEDPAPMQAFIPHAQSPVGNMAVALRVSGDDPASVLPAVTRRIRAADAGLPLIRVRPMQAIVNAALGDTRLPAVLITLFATLAGVVATVGIYSVMAYAVAQRTKEIGIRMAVGADHAAVRRLVLGEGSRLALSGVVIGLVGALALARLMASMFPAVSAADPWTLAATSAAVFVVTAAACYIPARRAMAVEPVAALRLD